MNKDRVKAAPDSPARPVQEQAGKTLGSSSSEQQARGQIRQGQARLRKAYAEVKDALRNSKHS